MNTEPVRFAPRTFPLLILSIPLFAWGKSPVRTKVDPLHQTVKISSITFGDEDHREGGLDQDTIYPTGYVKNESRSPYGSHNTVVRWFKVDRRKILQRYFDIAAAWVVALPQGKRCHSESEGKFSRATSSYTRIAYGGKQAGFCFSFGGSYGPFDTPLYKKLPPKPVPYTLPKNYMGDPKIVVGRTVKSQKALLALFVRKLEVVAKFSRADAKMFVQAVKDTQYNRDQARTNFIEKALCKLKPAFADLLPPLLDSPAFWRKSVIMALGKMGAAAQPYVKKILKSTRNDGDVVEAAIALHRIGGPEAQTALKKKLLPRLGRRPREKNLLRYYRLEFLRALQTIGTKQAEHTAKQKILPGIRRIVARARLTENDVYEIGQLAYPLAAIGWAKAVYHKQIPAYFVRCLKNKNKKLKLKTLQVIEPVYRGRKLPNEIKRLATAVARGKDEDLTRYAKYLLSAAKP